MYLIGRPHGDLIAADTGLTRPQTFPEPPIRHNSPFAPADGPREQIALTRRDFQTTRVRAACRAGGPAAKQVYQEGLDDPRAVRSVLTSIEQRLDAIEGSLGSANMLP